MPHGFNVHYAEEVKKAHPDTLVTTVGSIHNLDFAEEIIASGKADFGAWAPEAELGNYVPKGKQLVFAGGAFIGLEGALSFAQQGYDCTVIDLRDREAVTWALMGGNSMDAIMDLFAKLEENNVKFAFETAVKSFEADKVVCEDKDGNTVEFPCTDVLYAMGLKPRWDLVDELRHSAPETQVFIVGDCKQVGGNIGAAINGGFQAALHI